MDLLKVINKKNKRKEDIKMKKKIIIARLTEILGVGNFTNEDIEKALNSKKEDLEELFTKEELDKIF